MPPMTPSFSASMRSFIADRSNGCVDNSVYSLGQPFS